MDARTLRGMSADAWGLMGKPCAGARYLGAGDRRELLDGARCVVCGRPATNAHHAPPKGAGGSRFRLRTPLGEFPMRPALLAVCGAGNASGCHALLHSGRARVRWEWDDPASAALWESGEIPSRAAPNDPALFSLGRFVVESPYGRREERGANALQDAPGAFWGLGSAFGRQVDGNEGNAPSDGAREESR